MVSAILSARRSLDEASKDVKGGDWDRKGHTGDEIFGKTLGLIGVGEIGDRVARRARSLGLRVLGFDPFVAPFDSPVMDSGIELVSLDDVLKHSDFISLHVPLTSDTKNLINRENLEKMKPTACVINSSRGGIVNEQDLAIALQSKTISCATLDVLKQEPPDQSHPLMSLGNCTITPHIAGLTEESQIRTSEMVANEVINELEGKVSLCRVT